MELLDFLDEFFEAVKVNILSAQETKGNTWETLPRLGQEERIKAAILDYFHKYEEHNIPVSWEGIAGYALIGWVRENRLNN